MQQNILRDSSITKIFLVYVNNGTRIKETVKLRFMDSRQCYFAAPMQVNFQKPKKKISADIIVYTSDGVYKTKITLLDSNVSLHEVMYEVSIPKEWTFIQLRDSTRKLAALPVSVKYNDGFELNETSYDLSTGGVSFFSKTELSSVYKKISSILTLELPKNTIINFAEGKLTAEARFVRENDEIEGHFGEKLYIYKFVGITPDDENVLKTFLIKLD